uniref:Uncharacterized protein n=1 Tax=Caenorhabditis japonica TaxID=281687 RepID=A0A8R1HPE0_CAEJA
MHQEEKKPERFQNIQPDSTDAVEEVDMLRLEKLEQPSSSTTCTVLPSATFRSARYEKPKCAVCLEDGDGLHFGAEACRACTAFFRRSVALNKKYECRAHGNCEVASNIRCMCRACRFTKCLKVGMNPECVQNRRDITGAEGMSETKPFTIGKNSPPPPPPVPPSSSSSASSNQQIHVPVPVHQNNMTPLLDFSLFKSESTSSFSSFSLPASLPGLLISPSLDTMPLLERMRMNYEKMENARTVIHRRDGESIFQQKVPRSLNFREATEVTSKEVALVADWVEWCFDDFSVLPIDQKTILFQNFFVYFSVLEGTFMTMNSGNDNLMVMASKDYVDYANLEHFFSECDSDPSYPPEELARLIKPSFDLQKRSLINLMKIENLDQYEFFAICVMLFWDFGLEGQSDDCNEVGRKVKHQVAREMAFYLRHVKKHEEPLYRLLNMVAILPALQRAVRRFQEDIQMAHIFKIYALPANFYNIVNGKFS